MSVVEFKRPVACVQRFIEALQHDQTGAEVRIAGNTILWAICGRQATLRQPHAVLRVPGPQRSSAVGKVCVGGPNHGLCDRTGLPGGHLGRQLGKQTQQHRQ